MAKRGKKAIAEYSAEHRVSERTIKYWKRRGEELKDPCPLDSPEKLKAWRRRCFERQRGVELPIEPAAAVEPRDFSGVKSLDIEEAVAEFRHTTAVNKMLYDEALAGTNVELTTLRQVNFERCFNQLRLAEKSLIEIQKVRGKLIDRDQVIRDQMQFIEALKHERDKMTGQIMAELEHRMLPARLQRILRLIQKFLEPAIEKIRKSEELTFTQLPQPDANLILERE